MTNHPVLFAWPIPTQTETLSSEIELLSPEDVDDLWSAEETLALYRREGVAAFVRVA